MSEELDDQIFDDGMDGDDGITFDDAPPQVKPTVTAPKATKASPAPKAAPKAARKKPVATKAATAKTKKQHRVETIDNNKLAQYLDKITNDEGYELINVSGSSSIMGAFTVVSVKVS
jgi:hypothetical protein